ncbi:MAG: protein-glutamine glutaminase family protein [Planctomycetota bacterium]
MPRSRERENGSSEARFSHGLITSVGKFKGGASTARVQIEEFESGDGLDFGFERGLRLRSIFKEMCCLGMPLTVRGNVADSEVSFFGSLPFQFTSAIEHPTEFKVLSLSTQRETFVSKSNPHLESILEKIAHSRDFRVDYWCTILDPGADGRIEIINILYEVEPIKCFHERPFETQFDEDSYEPVSTKEVAKLHRYFEKISTNPNSGPLTGIPFKFVSDGCHHRAHEMSRILLEAGISPIKAWAFSKDQNNPLRYKTPYHPTGETSWAFHCAPAVLTKKGYLVIDPATLKKPRPVRYWFNQIRARGSKLYCTSHHVFRLSDSLCRFRSDPEYKNAQFRLRIYRINLRLMALRLGPLPFEHS